MASLSAKGLTDVGLRRANNEDSYLVDLERGLLVVADGMGGHAAGEIASQLAVEVLSDHVRVTYPWWPFRKSQREKDALLAAITVANDRIRLRAEADGGLRGMGTTVAVLWLRPPYVHIAHVGDSRIYCMRGGELWQLTTDHALAGESGMPSNILTRALGAEPKVEIDYQQLEVEAGEVFLLCSDGLNRTVNDDRIREVLRTAPDGETAAQKLIDLAREHGAPDNVTVIVGYV